MSFPHARGGVFPAEFAFIGKLYEIGAKYFQKLDKNIKIK
jgi:hypothetical protein